MQLVSGHFHLMTLPAASAVPQARALVVVVAVAALPAAAVAAFASQCQGHLHTTPRENSITSFLQSKPLQSFANCNWMRVMSSTRCTVMGRSEDANSTGGVAVVSLRAPSSNDIRTLSPIEISSNSSRRSSRS